MCFWFHGNGSYCMIGILVFLAGQNEITDLCRKLKAKFPPPKTKYGQKEKKEETNKLTAKEGKLNGY
jgi:hypothetical protein